MFAVKDNTNDSIWSKTFFVSERKLPWYTNDTAMGDRVVRVEFKIIRHKNCSVIFALFTEPNPVITSLAQRFVDIKQDSKDTCKWVVIRNFLFTTRTAAEIAQSPPPSIKIIMNTLEAAQVTPAEASPSNAPSETTPTNQSIKQTHFIISSSKDPPPIVAATVATASSSPPESSALSILAKSQPELVKQHKELSAAQVYTLVLQRQVYGRQQTLKWVNENLEKQIEYNKKLKRKLDEQNEEKRKKALVDASASTVSGECLVCFEAKPHLLTIVPCGHTFVCDACAKKFAVNFKVCAICSCPYNDFIKAYMPPPSSVVAVIAADAAASAVKNK